MLALKLWHYLVEMRVTGFLAVAGAIAALVVVTWVIARAAGPAGAGPTAVAMGDSRHRVGDS